MRNVAECFHHQMAQAVLRELCNRVLSVCLWQRPVFELVMTFYDDCVIHTGHFVESKMSFSLIFHCQLILRSRAQKMKHVKVVLFGSHT